MISQESTTKDVKLVGCEPQLSTIFGGKPKRRFLAGEKTPEFAKFQSKSAGKNFAIFALFCAYREHWCNEFAGPISASLCTGNTASFEEMVQRWRAIGNTVSDLIGLRFEPRAFRISNDCITTIPTARCRSKVTNFCRVRFDPSCI